MESKYAAIFLFLSACNAARSPHRSESASIDMSYPQPITLDRFEAMLQRASQILKPQPQPQVYEHSPEPNDHLYMPKERDQELNYYVPVYRNEKTPKLDEKSRQLQYMLPPSENNQETNFYVIKQKKTPKKFLNASKHINVKVVADGERGELVNSAPTRGYGNEHNIIFDDGFFGVDAQAAVPDEVPQEHSTDHGFIAPIYSRRLRKTEDMFATQTSKREARMRGMPITRFSLVGY